MDNIPLPIAHITMKDLEAKGKTAFFHPRVFFEPADPRNIVPRPIGPPPAPSRRGTTGFSLVELLIATALSTLLLLALISAWRAIWVSHNRNAQADSYRQAGHALLDRIAHDLLQASDSQFPGPPLWSVDPTDPFPLQQPVPILRILTRAPLEITGRPNPPPDGMVVVLYTLSRTRSQEPFSLRMLRMNAVYAAPEPGDELGDARLEEAIDGIRPFHAPIRRWSVSLLNSEDQWVEVWDDPNNLPTAVRLELEFGHSRENSVALERTLLLPAGPKFDQAMP